MTERRKNAIEESSRRISAAGLSAAEGRLGFALPEPLRKLLLRHNGGRPKRCCVIACDGDGRVFSLSCERLYAVADPLLGREIEDTYRTLVVEQRTLPLGHLPFAADGGDNPFCMDRETGEIRYCALDGGGSEPIEGLRVAGSLDEFLEEMLTEDEAERDPRWIAAVEEALKRPAPKAKRQRRRPTSEQSAPLERSSKVVGAKRKSAVGPRKRGG